MTEERCKDCPFFKEWSKYSGAEYPACSHPASGPRAVNLLCEIDKCPKL